MTESTMYWITRFDGINGFFNGLEILGILATFVASISLIVSFIIMTIERSSEYHHETDSDYVIAKSINLISLRAGIPSLAVAILSAFVRVFVPTTNEMIAIKVIPAVAASEQASKLKDISNDALDAASAWLKGQVEKIKNLKDNTENNN